MIESLPEPAEGYERWTVEFSFDVFDPAGRDPTEWDWGTIMAEAVGEEPDRIVEGAFRLYRVQTVRG